MSKRWFKPLGQHPETDRPIHGPRKHTVKEIAKGKAEENKAAKAAQLEEDMMQDPVATRERKNKTIKDAWQNQERGFGSKKSLLRDAKALDPSIKEADVDSWWNANKTRKNKLRGYNSFVPPHPLYELQVDLFYYDYKQRHNEGKTKYDKEDPYGILAADPFTKKIAVVPVSRKRYIDWVGAMKKLFSALGRQKAVFTDPVSSMGRKEME